MSCAGIDTAVLSAGARRSHFLEHPTNALACTERRINSTRNAGTSDALKLMFKAAIHEPGVAEFGQKDI
eukprot:6204396-Pleurochrysis_carterae.AAC.2